MKALEPELAQVKVLASEKDPALGTDQGWGLAQASGLVPGLAPVKARVTERDPASVWELASEQEPGLVLAQEPDLALAPG